VLLLLPLRSLLLLLLLQIVRHVPLLLSLPVQQRVPW
jgi:hypothetical protein